MYVALTWPRSPAVGSRCATATLKQQPGNRYRLLHGLWRSTISQCCWMDGVALTREIARQQQLAPS